MPIKNPKEIPGILAEFTYTSFNRIGMALDAVFIEAEIIKAIKPGTPAEESYLLALKLAEEMGYKDSFMGYQDDKVKFIGHGIGLELDEFPILAKGLKTPKLPGMTFALEPKFVFSEGAIGTENSFVMMEKGPESKRKVARTYYYYLNKLAG